MKISRADLRLSPEHPSLLLDLEPRSIPVTPLIVDPSGILVDGYRRFKIDPAEEFEVFRINHSDIFPAAHSLNLRTRLWDETDCFLWSRWANSLGVDFSILPINRFPAELQTAEPEFLKLIAARTLTLRQAVLILRAPQTYRPFFIQMLSDVIRLNNNESSDFVEICCDLKKILKVQRIEDVLPANFAGDSGDPRRKGQHLLAELRKLRYPRHTNKMVEFESSWTALNMGPRIHVAKSEFVERGKLEVTISASNHSEFQQNVNKIAETLDSPEWRKIWD